MPVHVHISCLETAAGIDQVQNHNHCGVYYRGPPRLLASNGSSDCQMRATSLDASSVDMKSIPSSVHDLRRRADRWRRILRDVDNGKLPMGRRFTAGLITSNRGRLPMGSMGRRMQHVCQKVLYVLYAALGSASRL